MGYPIPENEAARLADVHALDIHDTAAWPEMDSVCRLACEMLGVPHACVGILDRDSQWFKARWGVGFPGTSREHSFSAWTVMSDDILVIPDAAADPRFADNIYVTSDPAIRFYVGAPIAVRPGLNIGSLCIFGPEPRELRPAEADIVRHLARVVADQFRLHDANRRAKREVEHRRTSQSLLELQSRELWRRQSLLAQTERLAKVGGWEFDLRTQRLTWSDGIYRIYGITSGRDPSPDMALSHFPPEARAQFERKLRSAISLHQPFDIELPFINAQGESRVVRKTCDVELDGGSVVRAFGILQDITEQKDAEQRMWHMANHDALTDLPNRGLMRERLDAALRRARRTGTYVALLLIDLDQFKDVNDSLGHDAGDALLVEAARRLAACVGSEDMVARLGGDEFIVLLDRVEMPGDSLAMAERVLAALRLPFTFRRKNLSCRGSIGLALAPDHGTDPSELLKNADIALYQAKAGGRGIAVSYDSRMREAAENRIRLATRLRVALENKEFLPYYQPQVSLETGAISGFEALMRWKHPRKGLLGAQEFELAFEDADLAITLGEIMLQQVLRDIREWMAGDRDFGRIAINVSSAEFARGDLAERVLTALEAEGVPASRLTIEVTESVFLGRDIEAVRQSLQTLHAAGVQIALDDFGTGYASLTHLKQFPVDTLKIDQSFVRDIERDADDAAIVRTVIHLGHSLGIKTVAEGVETVSQAAYLRMNGCDVAQGYLFSKALPASRVPWLLRSWAPTRAIGIGFPLGSTGSISRA